jgi:dTDP-4-dehydrorhamnose reductase
MRIVLTGASGQLGAYLIERLLARGHTVIAWSGTATGTRSGIPLEPLDLTNAVEMDAALERARPEALIHAAAISSAAAVRQDPELGSRVNVDATAYLAATCERRGWRMLFTSTDLVFDGSRPFNREDDPAEPVMAYGRTKREAERSALDCSTALVCRLSLMFGCSRSGRPGYFDVSLEALRAGLPRAFFADEWRTPLHYGAAASILVELLESGRAGLVHVGGGERLSRHELLQRAAAALGLDASLVLANSQADVALDEPRPADVSLDTRRLASWLPDLHRPNVEESLRTASYGGAMR